MRSLVYTAAVVIAAIALDGCRPQAGSGLQTAPPRSPAPSAAASRSDHGRNDAPGEIAWFQGTFDEAFARPGCREHGTQLSF